MAPVRFAAGVGALSGVVHSERLGLTPETAPFRAKRNRTPECHSSQEYADKPKGGADRQLADRPRALALPPIEVPA
jgi:hypothetical protein